jgi:hypothetical protein
MPHEHLVFILNPLQQNSIDDFTMALDRGWEPLDSSAVGGGIVYVLRRKTTV